MKKIILLSFLISLFFFNESNASDYTQDYPKLLECKTCQSAYDYQLVAKNFSEQNQYVYVVVFNKSTEIIKTFRVFEVYEPQDPYLNMISATEISTKQSHINAFQNFLVHSKSSVEDDILDLNYADLPGVNPNSTGFDLFESTHGGYDVLQGALLSYLASNYNIFADRMFDVVQVKFSNGDTAVFAIDSDSRGALRSIVNIPILFVTDENGNVTHVFASNDTEVVQQSGTGGSYFLIVRVGGTKYCYGNCGNKGTVKIIEVTEE